MKLSIWRQFSSNHSASFTVVGEFSSEEQATQAADELRTIIAQIQQWWDEFSKTATLDELSRQGESDILTPVEEKLRNHYQVNWLFSVDWFIHYWDSHPVQQFGNIVFVENPHGMIWKGPQPFDGLMEKLGAKMSLEVDESKTHADTQLFFDIQCTLPMDESIATEIYEGFCADFEKLRAPYDPEYQMKYSSALGNIPKDIIYAGDLRIYEIERQERELHLYGLELVIVYSWATEFPEFIESLKTLGCTNIHYTFHSARYVGRKKT